MRVGSWRLQKGSNFERARELAAILQKCIREEGVTRAAIEIPMAAPPRMEKVVRKTSLGFETEMAAQGNITTQNLLWSLHGAISGALACSGIPGHPVGMGEWRKHTLGNGRIAGDEAKRRCRDLLSRLDVYCSNNDSAEAGGIMFWLNGHLRRFEQEDELRARQAA